MRYSDIRKSITKKFEKLGKAIYYENINTVKKPCYFIELVDYIKRFDSFHREFKILAFDILYFSKDNSRGEAISAGEDLDNALETNGKKVLEIYVDGKVVRTLTIINADIKEVDGVGHYLFELSLFDLYGTPYEYELMKDLELKFK